LCNDSSPKNIFASSVRSKIWGVHNKQGAINQEKWGKGRTCDRVCMDQVSFNISMGAIERVFTAVVPVKLDEI
jgi:hypothetical protein